MIPDTVIFRPYLRSLNLYALVEYAIDMGEDELDIKLLKINGIESNTKGGFAGYNREEVYNLALNHYTRHHMKHEWE